jgi:hypothetical protein
MQSSHPLFRTAASVLQGSAHCALQQRALHAAHSVVYAAAAASSCLHVMLACWSGVSALILNVGMCSERQVKMPLLCLIRSVGPVSCRLPDPC